MKRPKIIHILLCGTSLALMIALSPVFAALPADVPVIDLPRVDGIVIDGNTREWQERGLHVDILADASGHQPAPSEFAASFRAGWYDAGVLLAIEVKDISNHEADNPKRLYEGDSVEVFLTTDTFNGSTTPASDRNILQAVFSPGLSDTQPELRTFIYDYRSTAVRALQRDARVVAARMSMVNGYRLEAFIPWENLGITPEAGALVGLQVQINNGGNSAGNSRLVWNATPGIGHVVHLAAQPTAPIRLAATGRFDDYKSIRVDLTAKGPTAQPIEIRDGKQPLAKVTLTGRPDGLWTAQASLPVTGDSSPEQGPLTVAMLGLPASLSEAQLEAIDKLDDRTVRFAGSAAALIDSQPGASLLRPGNDEDTYRYRVMTAHGLEKPYTTVILKPSSYDEKPGQLWPLILFLHGSGRGTQAWADIEPTRIFLSEHREYPFLLVQLLAEQAPWTPLKVLDQLAALQKTHRIDPERMYLCGFSMGGAGTWEVLAEAPGRFAAAVPVSSRADLANAPKLVQTPIWAFHGDNDFVDPQSVTSMIASPPKPKPMC